ncbi:MAG: amidohydrolase family protein, partial [Clostridiales bacterium]|nr:amidohydrolase family protein [Clostridiales bacterium]
MSKITIKNGKILTPYRLLDGFQVLVKNDKIQDIVPNDNAYEDYKVIDAAGLYVSPGFIDIHTHGAGDYDFLDGVVESFLVAAETHAKYGTTTLYPTATTGAYDTTKMMFENFRKAKKLNKKGANLEGLHMEGPYFSHAQKGAQDPRYLRDPQPEE